MHERALAVEGGLGLVLFTLQWYSPCGRSDLGLVLLMHERALAVKGGLGLVLFTPLRSMWPGYGYIMLL